MSSHQIREADISRLSFAVELAEEFYGRFAQLYSALLSCLIYLAASVDTDWVLFSLTHATELAE